MNELLRVLASSVQIASGLLLCITFFSKSEKNHIVDSYLSEAIPDQGEDAEDGDRKIEIESEYVRNKKIEIWSYRMVAVYILTGFILQAMVSDVNKILLPSSTYIAVSLVCGVLIAFITNIIIVKYADRVRNDINVCIIHNKDISTGQLKRRFYNTYNNILISRQDKYRIIKEIWDSIPDLEKKLLKSEYVRDIEFHSKYTDYYHKLFNIILSMTGILSTAVFAYQGRAFETGSKISDSLYVLYAIIAVFYFSFLYWMFRQSGESYKRSFSRYMVDIINIIEAEAETVHSKEDVQK